MQYSSPVIGRDDVLVVPLGVEIFSAVVIVVMETKRVREALQRLSEEFREMILLREYEGFPIQEIATLLNCPPGTVMSRLAGARSKTVNVAFCRTGTP